MWVSCAVAAAAVATAVRAWRERALQRSSLRSTYSGERGCRGVEPAGGRGGGAGPRTRKERNCHFLRVCWLRGCLVCVVFFFLFSVVNNNDHVHFRWRPLRDPPRRSTDNGAGPGRKRAREREPKYVQVHMWYNRSKEGEDEVGVMPTSVACIESYI